MKSKQDPKFFITLIKEIKKSNNKNKDLRNWIENKDIDSIYKQLSILNNENKYDEIHDEYHFLINLLSDNIIIRKDELNYPNSTFYFKDKTLMLELQSGNGTYGLFVNYYHIWNPIQTEYKLCHEQIEYLIKTFFNKNFMHENINIFVSEEDLSKSYLIEKHFKNLK